MQIRAAFEIGAAVNPLTGGIRRFAWIQWVELLANGSEAAIGPPETWTVNSGSYDKEDAQNRERA